VFFMEEDREVYLEWLGEYCRWHEILHTQPRSDQRRSNPLQG
jgi:hypothetical protein